MADNWSGSPVGLTDAGDWAKWSITLGSTDAANLNGASLGTRQVLGVRSAMSAANRSGRFALVINDNLVARITTSPPSENVFSTNDWISARRFRGGPFSSATGFAAFDFPITRPTSSVLVVNGDPWVAGANSVRLLWLGDGDIGSFGGSQPVEIDFVAVQAGSGFHINDSWVFGEDDTDDPKPLTNAGAVGFDDHTDPAPVGISPAGPPTWILKGDDASTGTAAESVIEVIKFCPPVAKIRVTGSGSPISGLAGKSDTGSVAVTALDGAGEATFITNGDDAAFWFGGTDDWTPTVVSVGDDERIGCNGWHVGSIAAVS